MKDSTLKVSFELRPSDIRYFRERLKQASSGGLLEERKVLRGAVKVVQAALAAEPPRFVSERIEKLELLIEMLRDKEWRLEGSDRKRIVDALAYFVDPDDLIPDKIPGIGYLDDAIMVELVIRELTHEIDAYQDFCEYRRVHPKTPEPDALEKRRKSLQARMQRRRMRQRAARGQREGPARKSPLSLW